MVKFAPTTLYRNRRLMVVSQDSVRNSQGGKGRTVGVFVQCVPDSPGSQ